MVQDTNFSESKSDIPATLNKDKMMEAYREARRYSYLRSVVLTLIICVTLVVIVVLSFVVTLLLTGRI